MLSCKTKTVLLCCVAKYKCTYYAVLQNKKVGYYGQCPGTAISLVILCHINGCTKQLSTCRMRPYLVKWVSLTSCYHSVAY